MNYCTSCGNPIPDGQGKSCSMCFGDVNHGRDGYYQKWMEDQLDKEQYIVEEPPPHKDDF